MLKDAISPLQDAVNLKVEELEKALLSNDVATATRISFQIVLDWKLINDKLYWIEHNHGPYRTR